MPQRNVTEGGTFRPNEDYDIHGSWNFTQAPTIASVPITTTTASVAAITAALAAQVGSRAVKTAVLALTGAAIHDGTGGVIAWVNPEGAAILILRALLYLTTVSTGACTLDVGVTATSATTTSDTLLDGIDATTTAPALSDSMNAALDAGANAKAQPLASGKWVTIDEKTGDATGLVGNLYVQYILA